jgi:thiol-disulfide isomerase/thioredoxin
MPLLSALLVLIALVALATGLGLLWRRADGRAKSTASTHEVVAPQDVAHDGGFGERATLLQFSTEYCARCPATRRLLGDLAKRTDGVEHVDVDLTDAPGLARRFQVLQTPTTLLLDGHGVVRARIGGAPRPAELERSLKRILNGEDHVAA